MEYELWDTAFSANFYQLYDLRKFIGPLEELHFSDEEMELREV